MAELEIQDSDIAFEEELLRNPHSVKLWMRYIDHKSGAMGDEDTSGSTNLLYERAVRQLPGSYKLWYNYLKSRRAQVRDKPTTDPAYDKVNNAFERALVFLHKMPRIWIDYCKFLVDQCKVTKSRHTFDRALRSLPMTQHKRIWPLFVDFVRSYDLPETTVRVYRRYLKICPEETEEYIDYLVSIDRLDEAACRLVKIINDENFASKVGKSKHQLWHELCDLISQNPESITSLKVDPIIRGGIAQFTDSRGQLWNALADYHIRAGHFDMARDIFEEGIDTVTTVRDFVQIFETYSSFEEGLIQQRMEAIQIGDENQFPTQDEAETDLELKLARYEWLMDRRPLLLNSVLLRQNPHNVNEWHKRVELLKGHPERIVETYTEAVQTVEIELAVGKPHTLWCSFSRFYEENGQKEEARIVMKKGVQVGYKRVEDLANMWCEWAEMELRMENFEGALEVLKQATALPARKAGYQDRSEPVQNRVYKSLKVWSMYADLEESLGTFQTTKAVYERIIDLHIATPQIIINYGMFLEENKYFEEAFKAYEKGIALFKWPHVFDLWNTYLCKFTKRYLPLGGKYVERARELFEQALEGCPASFAKSIYLMYASLEEEHGLAKNAMGVYDRATAAVMPEDKLEIFTLYIKRAQEIFGVTYTREIYEKAIEDLPDESCRVMCMRYSELERALGEIDRARGVYSHAAQISDPRVCQEFWETWKEFEVKHGNEDTFREMLRIKRSVQAKYNIQVNFMSAQMASVVGTGGTTTGSDMRAENDMLGLEQRARELAQETGGGTIPIREPVKFVKASTDSQEQIKITNPDEIDLMDADSGEECDNETAGGDQLVGDDTTGSEATDDQLATLGAKARLANLMK